MAKASIGLRPIKLSNHKHNEIWNLKKFCNLPVWYGKIIDSDQENEDTLMTMESSLEYRTTKSMTELKKLVVF